MKAILLFLTLFTFLEKTCCQANIEITDSAFKSTLIKDYPMYVNPKTNRMYGCEMRLECYGGKLIITNTRLHISNDKKYELELEGFLYIVIAYPINDTVKNGPEDTVGIEGFQLFIAEPGGKYLKNKKFVFIDSSGMNNSVVGQKPFNGHFKAKFAFTEKDRLYIDAGGMYRFREYDLKKILPVKTPVKTAERITTSSP